MMPKPTPFLLLLLTLPFLASALALNSTNNNHSSLCSYNILAQLPSQKNYTYSITSKKYTPTYNSSDFSITPPLVTNPSSSFFNWIGLNPFRNSFQSMGCQITNQSALNTVCGIPNSKVNNTYRHSFGQDIAFQCQVPANHFVLGIAFTPKVSTWSTSPPSTWSIFQGLYKFTTASEAQSIIKS